MNGCVVDRNTCEQIINIFFFRERNEFVFVLLYQNKYLRSHNIFIVIKNNNKKHTFCPSVHQNKKQKSNERKPSSHNMFTMKRN